MSAATRVTNARIARRGFTLAEVLTALVLIGLVVGAASAALSQLSRASRSSAARAQAMERAHSASEMIARETVQAVRAADLYAARVAIEQVGVAGAGRDQLLVYARTLAPARPWADAPEGSEKEVQFRVEDDTFAEVGGAGSLWRRVDPVPDDEGYGGGVASAMVDGIVSIDFEALDGDVWVETWDSDLDGYPYAVRVTVVATDDSGRYRVTSRRVASIERVPIPVDSSSGGLDALLGGG